MTLREAISRYWEIAVIFLAGMGIIVWVGLLEIKGK